jgi:hypothetical protein
MCKPFVAQAVSRGLPNSETQVRYQVRSCEICGEQSRTGISSLPVFQFPLPILIPPPVPYSSIILSSTLYRLDGDSVVK